MTAPARRWLRPVLGLGLAVLYLAVIAAPGSLSELALTVGAIGAELIAIAAIYGRAERRLAPGAALVATAVAAAALAAALALVVAPLAADPGPRDPPGSLAVGGATIGLLLLGLYVLVVRHPRALEEARALRLESELASLRGRLEPHFLLNSLNAIAGLVGEHPTQARRALAALGDLLAEALERAPDRVHTLAAEIAWLRAYVIIFEARYGDGLVVTWDISPEVDALSMPRLLLQPLVENAMLHGIAVAGAGTVAIAARRAGRTVTIAIASSGPSVSDADCEPGHGLALVRRRLALELPGATLRIAADPAGGTVATITIG